MPSWSRLSSCLLVALGGVATLVSGQDAAVAPTPVVSVAVEGYGALELFAGDRVDHAIDAFIGKHAIAVEARPQLIEAVVARIRAQAPKPVAQVTVMLPAVFNIYNPENLEQETKTFCQTSGIKDSASCQQVYDAAALKLRPPVLTIPFQLTAEGPPQSLALYEGDDVKEAVLAFAQKHNLNQEGANQVYTAVAEKLNPPGSAPAAATESK